MRYFIVLLIIMSNILQGTSPQLTTSRLSAQSASTHIEQPQNDDTHSNTTTTPYLYLHRESPWPTCKELIECAQCCCHAVVVLTKLCIKDAYRRQRE